MKLPIFNTPSRPKTDPERPLSQTDLPASYPSANAPPAPQTQPAPGIPSDNESQPFDPTGLAEHPAELLTVDPVRNAVLQRLLWVAVLMGILALAASLLRLIQPVAPAGAGPGALQWSLPGLIGLAWIALIVALARRSLSYSWRTALLLLALFAMGMAALLTDGLAGSGPVILVAIPFIAAILTQKPARLASLALSISALILAGVLIFSGAVAIPQTRPAAGLDSILFWGITIANFLLLAVVGATAAGMLLDELQQKLAQQQILADDLNRERSQLEIRVTERANDLQRRLVQIRTVAEINRAISRVLDTDELLPQVCELVRQRFDLYYVGVFLIEPGALSKSAGASDPSPKAGISQPEIAPASNPVFAFLRAGSGEAGRKMLAEGHKLAVGGDSMIGWATARGQPRISQNVSQESGVNVIARFNNPHLPRTRSELALPIQISEATGDKESPDGSGQETRILGAMTIQSTQERAFDQDDIAILQGIADGLASALENARLFKATQASLEEIRLLHRQYLEQAWSLETALRGEIAYSFENEAHSIASPPGASTATSDASAQQPLELPIRLRDQVIGSLTLEPAPGEMAAEGEPHAWTAEDLALIEAITSQAALALENARLLEETRRKVNLEHTAASITSKLWASADVETILRTALQELGSSLDARHGSIELWPAETRPGGSQPASETASEAEQWSGEELYASD